MSSQWSVTLSSAVLRLLVKCAAHCLDLCVVSSLSRTFTRRVILQCLMFQCKGLSLCVTVSNTIGLNILRAALSFVGRISGNSEMIVEVTVTQSELGVGTFMDMNVAVDMFANENIGTFVEVEDGLEGKDSYYMVVQDVMTRVRTSST